MAKPQEDDKKKDNNKNDSKTDAEDNSKRIAEMEQFFSKYREDIALVRNLILQVQEVVHKLVNNILRISAEKLT
jgi:hypothetical protein